MTRYRLTKDHFIPDDDDPINGPVLHVAGTEIEWGDKLPSLAMEGLDDEGRKKIKDRATAEKEKREKAAAQLPPGASTRIMDSVIPKVEESEPQLIRRRGR
jgi:hypothetical protein